MTYAVSTAHGWPEGKVKVFQGVLVDIEEVQAAPVLIVGSHAEGLDDTFEGAGGGGRRRLFLDYCFRYQMKDALGTARREERGNSNGTQLSNFDLLLMITEVPPLAWRGRKANNIKPEELGQAERAVEPGVGVPSCRVGEICQILGINLIHALPSIHMDRSCRDGRT